MDLEAIRRFYAEEIEAVAGLRSQALVLGARDEAQNLRFRDGLARGTWGTVRSLRRDQHEADASCWLHGEGVCLSTSPLN